ncbi:MAG: acetyl-CoA C-acetyltransferase [Planctomycetes bacterium]|nr:acetyl-CoA C-acetyltransferase [Planctomycetota bacterium]MCC7171074.1 acetyl-CoA C-acetyltransferase [Planctomycetota bacterium]
MLEAVIVSACRTPIGKFQGAFASMRAPELGAVAIKDAVARAGLTGSDIEEVIFGCVLQAGLGQNPARQAARGAGLPDAIGSVTINKVCGSGLKSVMLAAQAIRAGDAKCLVAGGMESMSNAPYLLPAGRNGARLGHTQLLDAMVHDGLWDIYNDYHMGITAENVASRYEIGRDPQDQFAANSQSKAVAAMKAGKFAKEITPVAVPQKKGEPVIVRDDEGPRAESTVDALAKLRPAFKKDGTVTAGNASTINDGAAAVVVMEAKEADRRGLKPLARILGYATGGMAPEWVMMAPVEAVKNLNGKLGLKADAYGVVELNEAFSVQALAVSRECGFDPARVNVNGGAVALGHPIGASGCRVLVTLLHAMEQKNERLGLASLCLGGGNAVALAVERIG